MRKRRLNSRDTELLVRTARYGHFTIDVVLLWYPQLSRTAAGSWTKRLRQSGYLESAPLDRHRHYYRLSERAVAYLRHKRGVRVSRAATRPLKPYRKPEKYAFLLFCSMPTQPSREPYRPGFDSSRFPEIAAYIESGKADPLRQKLFYAAGADVGFFVLDRGHPAFVERKLKPKVAAVLKWKPFQALLSAGHFRLTIITSSESRKRELEQDIKREPPPFHWEVVVLECRRQSESAALGRHLGECQRNVQRTTVQILRASK